MENRREERLQKLGQAVKKSGRIHLKDAAQLLNVSEMTIRRDLSSGFSPVTLLGGYIVIEQNSLPVTHYFVSDQQRKQVVEKHYIGELAAKHVKDGDIVFFDCGTTIPFVIDAISDDIQFTAICYSFNTFLALQNKPKCKVILCGGEFKPDNNIFVSISQDSELDHLYPTKAFISAAGISMKYGLTCFTLDEVKMKNYAMEMSRQTILVVDSSKFEQVKPARFGQLSQLGLVITDSELPTEFAHYFEQQEIEVHY